MPSIRRVSGPWQRPLMRRYPWVKLKEKRRMTIAIGMLYNFGALLCADTQHETYTIKTHESKLGDFKFPGGRLAYALAGNSRFAKSAMQKCEKELVARKQIPAIRTIEKVLDKEFRRNVLRHPAYATDPSIPYWILMSLWTQDDGLKLYLAWETSVQEVDGFECIGAGQDLAQYIIYPSYYRRL